MSAIERIEVDVYTIPTDAPEGDGTFAWDSTTMTVVRITADGRVGTGWTYGAPECGAIIHSTLAKTISGRDPLDIPGAWEAMVRSVRNSGRQGAVGYAISAVNAALWDVKARLLGVSLQALLGAQRTEVPVYASGGFTTYDDRALDDQIAGWMDAGSTAVKIKVGESWGTKPERDLARMSQTRHLIGPDVKLFIDANGGYSAKQAIRIMEAADDLDVRWFEEPVSSDNLAGLAEVRAAVRADVAAGEYGYDIFEFRRLCESRAVDVSRRSRHPSVSTCPDTARPTCTLTWRPRLRTCATWSGSTITTGSSDSSSTARSRPRMAWLPWMLLRSATG
jgi:L-alanine-DL-glutamate epimerase-like enolase superfamily enzyme